MFHVRAADRHRRIRPLRTVAVLAMAALALPLVGPSPAMAHPPGTTELVSVGVGGAAGDDESSLAAISGDGRFVAFRSFASNLVAGDTNGATDVFVYDRSTGGTERVSVDSRERQAADAEQSGVLDTNYGPPAISADGRYVAFASSATNLVKGDRNQVVDIFLRDRAAGTTERITMASRRVEADGDSSHPVISPDGRFVAFSSFASNLAAGDGDFASDVFLHDRATGTNDLISVSSTGERANNSSGGVAITPDGRFVAFGSSATNLTPGEVDDFADDVYLRDRQAGTTVGITTVGSGILGHSAAPSISADGRLVAFHSWDSNLAPGDTNGRYDVFVFDRAAQTFELVSVDSAGVQGNNDSVGPAISADGSIVAFTSDSDNLVAGDGNFDLDVFVRNRLDGTTARASVRTDGTETGMELASLNVSMSSDGQALAFQSEGALVAGDSEFPVDVFVHQHQ